MKPFEIDAPGRVHGLQLGAGQTEVRGYFGAGCAHIADTPNGVPADFWPDLGVTAFYSASGELFYLAFEHDNVALQGNRLNGMSFAKASSTIEALYHDTVAGHDLASSPSGRIAVMRSERIHDAVGATCIFAEHFIEIWVQPEPV